MATDSNSTSRAKVFNIPNQLTAARLILAVLFFVLASLDYFFAALVVFLIAASTDWLDGYLARRFQQVTQLGRMFDPFVDKIIVCGAFIFLAAEPDSGVWPWMAVVVVGRELLVTALRSFIEQSGGDFSAQLSGKLKMVLQCAAVVASYATLTIVSRERQPPPWLEWTLFITVWAAVLTTIQSGVSYVVMAARLWKS